MKLLNLKKLLLVYLSLLLLVGCGFHLRGVGSNSNTLNNQTYFVQTNGTPEYVSFAMALKSSIRTLNGTVVDKKEDAEYILNITKVYIDTELTGIAGGASSNTYLLQYTVGYNVKNQAGSEVVASKELMSQHEFQTNTTIRLAGNAQETRLKNVLKEEVSDKVANQIAVLNTDAKDKAQAALDKQALEEQEKSAEYKPIDKENEAIDTVAQKETQDLSIDEKDEIKTDVDKKEKLTDDEKNMLAKEESSHYLFEE